MPDQVAPRLPRWFQWYMYVVAIGGNLIFYIQAYEIFTTQSARDVSLAAFSVALWAVTSWFVYGLVLRNPVLIIANIVAIIGAALVVAGKLLYG
jgi:MtN3 and saliva related transmembrane protein